MKLYRKRLIPTECIHLKDDVVLFHDKDQIITSWNVLKPKVDIHHGFSCYLPEQGYKISKFYDQHNQLLYWYCDIIEYEYFADTDTYIFTDLLADVVIMPDGFVKVLDLEELTIAFDEGLLSIDQLKCSLNRVSSLLSTIYNGDFDQYKSHIETFEQTTS